MLWDGSEPAPAATGQQPPYAGAPAEESGQGTPIARGQSISSVANPDAAASNRLPSFDSIAAAAGRLIHGNKNAKLVDVVAEAAFSGSLAGEDVTSQHTPMMQQCLRTKRYHPDTIFFIWNASGRL